MHRFAILPIAGAVALLAGCSGGGPSNDEVTQALQARVQGTLGVHVASAHRKNCTRLADASHYQCLVDIELEAGGQREHRNANVQFEKTGNTWEVAGVLQM